MVEVTFTLGILMLVLGSLLTVFSSAQRSQAYVTNRSESLDGLRIAMDRVTKDVRQATSVDASSGASRLQIQTFVLGVTKQVVYSVSGTTLYRQEGTGAAVPIQAGLTTSSVFTYTPGVTGAQVIAISISMRPVNAPATVLQLESEIRLRNAG